jgi:histidinol-phosphate/aromatic aminotransferase/cobyric acid decarboxylase-like protein
MRSASSLAREEVKRLKPCAHGGEVWDVVNKIGLSREDVLDFSSNVNPLGPSQKVIESIRAILGKFLFTQIQIPLRYERLLPIISRESADGT